MIMRLKPVIAGIVLLFLAVVVKVSLASEYIGNNQRSSYINVRISANPTLLWTYKERHPPRTVWPEPFGELQFIDFDYSGQVTIGKQMAYFGSSAGHVIRALDVNSGKEQSVFYTEGPVRGQSSNF